MPHQDMLFEIPTIQPNENVGPRTKQRALSMMLKILKNQCGTREYERCLEMGDSEEVIAYLLTKADRPDFAAAVRRNWKYMCPELLNAAGFDESAPEVESHRLYLDALEDAVTRQRAKNERNSP